MQRSFQDAYEVLYTGRSYQHEIGMVDALLDRTMGAAGPAKGKPPRHLLELGCGPGLRLSLLRQWHGKYQPEGLDKDPMMLALAAKRVPGVPLHEADIRTMELGTTFDAITCLFGMIGYLQTVEEMTQTFARIRAHLRIGGVFLLEPWLTPDLVTDRYVNSDYAKRGGLDVARMNFTRVEGNRSHLTIHYLIGSEAGVDHVEQQRVLTLFTHDEYRAAFRAAGFGEPALEAYGPQGRGLYVATRGE